MDPTLETELKGVIGEVRDVIENERATRARQITTARVAIVVAIAVGLAGALVNYLDNERQDRDRTTGRVVACQRDNRDEEDETAKFNKLITMLGAFGQQTPERVAVVENFRSEFFEGSPPLRNCSPDAVNRAARG